MKNWLFRKENLALQFVCSKMPRKFSISAQCWSDERRFKNVGVFNTHNSLAGQNYFLSRGVHHKVRWGFRVWLNGLQIFKNNLTAPQYFDILQDYELYMWF